MVPRSTVRLLVLVALLVGSTASGAWGTNPFTDIGGQTAHANNIDAIYNAGITAGCVQGPTFYCPGDNVTRAQMASFLARLGGLSSGSTKNFPKANARSDVQSYCALVAANPGSFDDGPCRATTATLASTGIVGEHTAITTNGLPVVSYYDVTNQDLKVAACSDAQCIGEPTITTLDSAANVGQESAIAIGAGGRPVISYLDGTNLDLKFIACRTMNCSGPSNPIILDDGLSTGHQSSIAVGANDLPIISYYDFTNHDLRTIACTTVDCSGATTSAILDAAGDVGMYSSIAIGVNALPVISYFDLDNGDLKIAACGTANCSGAPTITTLDGDAEVGYETAITIGANGLPIVSYRDNENQDLKVAACVTANCSAATITVLDSTGFTGVQPSIAIGTNGKPIIGYHDVDNSSLKFAACSTTDCTGTTTITVLDNAGSVGAFSSMTLGTDGVPIVSYFDGSNGDLKIARPAVS